MCSESERRNRLALSQEDGTQALGLSRLACGAQCACGLPLAPEQQEDVCVWLPLAPEQQQLAQQEQASASRQNIRNPFLGGGASSRDDQPVVLKRTPEPTALRTPPVENFFPPVEYEVRLSIITYHDLEASFHQGGLVELVAKGSSTSAPPIWAFEGFFGPRRLRVADDRGESQVHQAQAYWGWRKRLQVHYLQHAGRSSDGAVGGEADLLQKKMQFGFRRKRFLWRVYPLQSGEELEKIQKLLRVSTNLFRLWDEGGELLLQQSGGGSGCGYPNASPPNPTGDRSGPHRRLLQVRPMKFTMQSDRKRGLNCFPSSVLLLTAVGLAAFEQHPPKHHGRFAYLLQRLSVLVREIQTGLERELRAANIPPTQYLRVDEGGRSMGRPVSTAVQGEVLYELAVFVAAEGRLSL